MVRYVKIERMRQLLEPTAITHGRGWTKRLVDHFEDLSKAHDAVRTARDQLAELRPLLDDCDSFGTLQGAAAIGFLTLVLAH